MNFGRKEMLHRIQYNNNRIEYAGEKPEKQL